MDLEQAIHQLIDRAIAEDIGTGDVTTAACVPEQAKCTCYLVLKQTACLAALPFLRVLYKKIDPAVEVTLFVEEGTEKKAGTVVGKISGPARSVLSGERIALNLVQH